MVAENLANVKKHVRPPLRHHKGHAKGHDRKIESTQLCWIVNHSPLSWVSFFVFTNEQISLSEI